MPLPVTLSDSASASSSSLPVPSSPFLVVDSPSLSRPESMANCVPVAAVVSFRRDLNENKKKHGGASLDSGTVPPQTERNDDVALGLFNGPVLRMHMPILILPYFVFVRLKTEQVSPK